MLRHSASLLGEEPEDKPAKVKHKTHDPEDHDPVAPVQGYDQHAHAAGQEKSGLYERRCGSRVFVLLFQKQAARRRPAYTHEHISAGHRKGEECRARLPDREYQHAAEKRSEKAHRNDRQRLQEFVKEEIGGAADNEKHGGACKIEAVDFFAEAQLLDENERRSTYESEKRYRDKGK